MQDGNKTKPDLFIYAEAWDVCLIFVDVAKNSNPPLSFHREYNRLQ